MRQRINSSKTLNRRAFLGLLFAPMRERLHPTNQRAVSTTDSTPLPNRKAIIQGRHCLAYRALSCSSCHEQCPVPGALILEQGIPRVQPDLCTGCARCHEVCPAPINAVLLR